MTNNLFGKMPKPADAAVGIITRPDGRYLLQLRDDIPGIFFPGHWGLFGGAMDAGESPEAALRRELREELGVDFDKVTYFTEFTFDFPVRGKILRRYYEVPASDEMVSRMVLAEGAGMDAFPVSQIMTELRTVPYDGFAIWMHTTCR
ncbi:MAG: nucleoside triphosphatase [Hyphomicrobiales bacterium]|nr:nucleoside triphosphatase [Hyphomicrobiales bacterium]